MIVTWLHDGKAFVSVDCAGFDSRISTWCGTIPGQRADPHIHVVGRDDNPNGARACRTEAPQR